jgi:hypothetical protein
MAEHGERVALAEQELRRRRGAGAGRQREAAHDSYDRAHRDATTHPGPLCCPAQARLGAKNLAPAGSDRPCVDDDCRRG